MSVAPAEYVIKALRRSRTVTLSQYLARRARGTNGPIPTSEGEYAWTADCVIDDPREPRLTPTGVLDERGMMLIRVAVPIKVPMGFAIPNASREPDEVETIIPEDMLSVSDIGLGIGYIEPHEVDFGDDDEDADPSEPHQVMLSEIVRTISAQGVVIIDDMDHSDG